MPSEKSDKMTVSELARICGVTTATVNYYVQQELLPPPEKPSKTRAFYGQEHVRLIRYIKRLQANGYSLQLIKRTLDVVAPTTGSNRLESMGTNHPIPPFRAGPPREAVIDEPVDREAYLRLTGLTDAQLDKLEADGILQLTEPGTYDAGDVEVGQHVRRLLDFGMPFAELDVLVGFGPLAQQLCRSLAWLYQVNNLQLARGELRHRDISDPLFRIFDYTVTRTFIENYPEFMIPRRGDTSSTAENN